MWQDLLSALALVLVVEGLLPFINPRGVKRSLYALLHLHDRVFRWGGLISMLGGLSLLWWIR